MLKIVAQKANQTTKQRNTTIAIVQDRVSAIDFVLFSEKSATILDAIVGQGLRRNKAQGALRGGIHCTSSMKVEIQNDEHITVQYYPAHYGHSNLTGSEEAAYAENNLNVSNTSMHQSQHQLSHHHHQQQQQQQQQQQLQDNARHGGDRSSSSSPGSSSTSPSGGSNSNSNHPPMMHERQSMNTISASVTLAHPTNTITIPNNSSHSFLKNINHQSLQNQMSHCLVISPSFMLEDNPSLHSSNNSHATSVLVVQQNLPISSNSLHTSPKNKGTCVSDIMHEAFQLLSYWPLEHHHDLIASENEQLIPHARLNMDEHLMF